MTASPGRFATKFPAEDIRYLGGFAIPPSPPVRLLRALVSVFRLVRNKEDTRQVFEIVQALAGKSGETLFERLIKNAYGRRLVAEPVRVEKILGDSAFLRALPEGSLGRAYLDFMEGENLTADGLVAAAGEAGVDYLCETDFPEFRRLFLYLSVVHDLWHVLTGYGRDALGELCVLAFTYQQTRNPGLRLIILIGLLAQKREAMREPLISAVNEGAKLGREAVFLLEHDVEALLSLSVAEARRRLNIGEPVIYKAVPRSVKARLLQPKVVETQSQREARHGGRVIDFPA